MPYEIVKSTAGGKKGYRVRKEGTTEYFSKEALPLKRAKAQRTAIAISETKQVTPMQAGGMVPNPQRYKAIQGRSRDYGDVVPAVLEPGELVIPVEHTPKVASFLKKKGIKLPGM